MNLLMPLSSNIIICSNNWDLTPFIKHHIYVRKIHKLIQDY